jgi:hypothetical protein
MSQGPNAGQVGYQRLQDGAGSDFRFSRGSELIVSDGLPKYYEQTLTQLHFGALIASVAPGTAISTTPPLAIWNPPNSGVLLVPTLLAVGYVSGTLGAGFLNALFVASQQTAPTTGTELTPFGMILNATKGRGRAFSGSTLAATPVACGVLGSLQATLATAPAAGGFSPFVQGEVGLDGRFIVPPGSVFGVQAVAAAGTTPLVAMSLSWLEIPTTVP